MSAYVIVDIEVRDAAAYAAYRDQAPATVAAYGGRYLARGGRTAVLEGDWAPERLVVLEFPTLEQAQAWWSSPEYSAIKGVRQRTTLSKLVAVEGLA